LRVVALVSVSSPGWLCCLRLRGILHQHVACGSFRRLPIRSFHASVSCDLAVTRRPARFASPGSARVANLSALFHAESSIGTLPSEVSPRSSPPDPLGSCRPPCRFPSPLQVMPRFRGFELFNAVSPCGDIHSSNGCVLRRRRCSRLRRVAPLLVVVPLRGLTFRPRSTLLQNLLSWAFIVRQRLGFLAVASAPSHVRSSEFQRSGMLDSFPSRPPWGSCLRNLVY